DERGEALADAHVVGVLLRLAAVEGRVDQRNRRECPRSRIAEELGNRHELVAVLPREGEQDRQRRKVRVVVAPGDAVGAQAVEDVAVRRGWGGQRLGRRADDPRGRPGHQETAGWGGGGAGPGGTHVGGGGGK